MGRPKTPSVTKDVIGQLFRDRVTELMVAAFPQAPNETEQIKALAKRSGVGKETIRAALKGERSPRLVAVDAVARALGMSIAELLGAKKPEGEDRSEPGAVSPFPQSPQPKKGADWKGF